MKIFKEIELILANTGLSNDQFVEINGKIISRSTVRVFLFSMPTLCSIVEGIICVKGLGDGVPSILYALCMLLTFLSGSLIYSSLMFKSSKIVETFLYLESAINTNKFFSKARIGACKSNENVKFDSIAK